MTLREVTRIVKISAFVAGFLSILVTATWVTVRVFYLKKQDGDCQNLVQQTTVRVINSTINPGRGVSEEPCNSQINRLYDEEDSFIFTFSIVYAILNVLAQIWLYIAANHKSIRKTQVVMLFIAAGTIINLILSIYLLVVLKFEDFGMTSFNSLSGVVQLFLIRKFLGYVISSSPRASLVSTNTDEGGGQEPDHQVN